MTGKEKVVDLADVMRCQWKVQPQPPSPLVEQRVLELECMGFVEVEETPDSPSSLRQFAIATLLHSKLPYFITADDDLLENCDMLEERYGLQILSVFEAMMLLREPNGLCD